MCLAGHPAHGPLAGGFPDPEQIRSQLMLALQKGFRQHGALMAAYAPELRPPLTAMRAVGEVALRERNPAILHDAVGSMLEEIVRMNQLIDRLLLLTRPDDNEMPLDMEAW